MKFNTAGSGWYEVVTTSHKEQIWGCTGSKVSGGSGPVMLVFKDLNALIEIIKVCPENCVEHTNKLCSAAAHFSTF